MRRAFDYVLGQSRRRKAFKDIDCKFSFIFRGGEIALPQNSEILDELIDAVLNSRSASITYRHFDGSTEQVTLHPLSLCIYDHQLYLVGETEDGRRHPYRFSRVVKVHDVKAVEFNYPPKSHYDAEQFFGDSFGVFVDPSLPVEEICLKLNARWITFASSHRWHRTQRIEQLDTGEVLVWIRARVCPEVIAWALGFGPEAVVLEPQSLRAKVAAQHRQAAERYLEGTS